MRQFILEQNPDKNGLVSLGGKDFRYLRQVLRIKVGDMVTASLPDGSIQTFTVTTCDMNSKKILLQVCGTNVSESKNVTRGVSAQSVFEEKTDVEFWLFQFLPRIQKLEQIIKQATECGIKKIVLINSEYSEESSLNAFSGNKKERLLKIIKEARQQSGSPVLTEFTQPLKLQEAIDLWKNYITSKSKNEVCEIVLSERNEDTHFIDQMTDSKSVITAVCVTVGNEGGVSPFELELLKNNSFIPVHFEGNILRCETAALYGIACSKAFVEKNNREKVQTQIESDNFENNSDDNKNDKLENSLEPDSIKDGLEEYGEEAWL